MADPVKHVVSVLKTALDQIQNNNLNATHASSQCQCCIPIPVPTTSGQQNQFVDAVRRDFSYLVKMVHLSLRVLREEVTPDLFVWYQCHLLDTIFYSGEKWLVQAL